MDIPKHITSMVDRLTIEGTTKFNENGAMQIVDGSSGVGIDNSTIEDISDYIKADFCQIFVKMIGGFSREKTSDVINSVVLRMNKDNVWYVFDGLCRLVFGHVREISRNGKGIGKGRRDQFYYSVLEMYKLFPLIIEKIIPHIIVHYGCWVDIIKICNMIEGEKEYSKLYWTLIDFHIKAIRNGDFLANKWAPREKSTNGHLARIYAKRMNPSLSTSYKIYRQHITRNSSQKAGCFLIETYMSFGEWDKVANVLDKLTGKSRAKYTKAFLRHIREEYMEYLEDVRIGKKKQNITGRTVKDIVSILCNREATWGGKVSIDMDIRKDLDTTWSLIEDNLLSKLLSEEISYETFMALGVIDRSGSMSNGPDAAAVGLGLLMSRVTARYELEKFGKILYGDKVLRFSRTADVILLDIESHPNFSDYLNDYFVKENRYACGYNTDIVKLHEKVIEISRFIREDTGYKKAPSLRIYTDMQYDDHQIEGQRSDKVIDDMYRLNDLERGITYCWNLRGDTDTMDSPFDKEKVQQLGGCNPTMIKLYCEGEKMTTWDTCVSAIKNYDYISELIYKNIEEILYSFPESPFEKMLLESFSEIDYYNFWGRYRVIFKLM